MPAKKTRILILNGPNLNRLGLREVAIYGRTTLKDIENLCRQEAKALGLDCDFLQSNHEGVLLDYIHAAPGQYDGIIINPGAYGHTSVALHDALKSIEIPALEVHISNIYKREEFRHHSYISSAVVGVLSGLGVMGYIYALRAHADGFHKPEAKNKTAKSATKNKKR
jgi:3-dehydroquinate dehydratase II